MLRKRLNNKKFSKLWLYNLHYFDDLNSNIQSSYKNELRVNLVYKWIDNNTSFHGIGWEPYPTSIRIVNWIKWSFKGVTLSEKFSNLYSLNHYFTKKFRETFIRQSYYYKCKGFNFCWFFLMEQR